MIVCIHQPSFWPWLGLLNKISNSDIYVILDDVPSNKESNQYRNLFFCNSKAKYLTLPVNYKMGRLIKDLSFKNSCWPYDHINKLSNYYRKAPYFSEIMPHVEIVYNKYSDQKPVNFIIETMKASCRMLNIKTKFIKSSSFNLEGMKDELVYNICLHIGTDVYLSGIGAVRYMNEEIISKFQNVGIRINWQNFEHPQYIQEKSKTFIKGLSCLDLLFWYGIDNSRHIFYQNEKI